MLAKPAKPHVGVGDIEIEKLKFALARLEPVIMRSEDCGGDPDMIG